MTIAKSTCTTFLLFFPIFAASCNGNPRRPDPEDWSAATEQTQLHDVALAQPPSSGMLKTDKVDMHGDPIGIDCVTCHQDGSVTAFAKHEGEARDFHAHISLDHGNLECGSCHVLDGPNNLHTSNGKTFPITESMTLCSQCHGPIRTAYDHGAHGGMRGYWDLQRGPRERNDCISCHSPHAPAYPKVMPVPGPKDRNVFKRVHEGSIIEQRFGGDNHE